MTNSLLVDNQIYLRFFFEDLTIYTKDRYLINKSNA